MASRDWYRDAGHDAIPSRLGETVIGQLRDAGHDIEVMGPFAEMMGHAGEITRSADGLLTGATDPRGNGAVAAR